MENESKKSPGFGDSAGSSEKPKTRRSRKKKSDLITGSPTAPEEKKELAPVVEPEVKEEPAYEPPAPSAPTPPAPVVAQGRTKPHRIFPSRYRP